ncbi:MAG: beta-galactosidase [Candidatus Hydrogenedentes bacterium]|nr:beta-galactosidase [Candidatus Hydrogenedentota bacterium]
MSEHEPPSSQAFYWRAAGVLVLMVLAALLGLWLGNAPGRQATESPAATKTAAGPKTPVAEVAQDAQEPPLFFFANPRSGTDLAVVSDELKMAVRNGIHGFCIGVPLSWSAENAEAETVVQRIKALCAADPHANILLYIVLDPPATWLDAHPADTMQINSKPHPAACVASSVWRHDVTEAIDRLMDTVQQADPQQNVSGYVIAALEGGQWYHADGYDTSSANTEAYQVWLQRRYKTDEALSEAWGSESKALSLVSVPLKPVTGDTQQVFFELPDMRRNVDFLHFVSDSVAEAIEAVSAHIKQRGGPQTRVMAPYGYSFELTKNDAGHFSLIEIIDSEVDGFWSPVCYADRGLGGAGGFMGPVDSAMYHEKQWYILDDTRTGISQDPANGAISRIKGLRPEDVYRLQTRNYAEAVCHKLGLVWADTEPDGRLLDDEMWKRFGAMREKYQSVYSPPASPETQPAIEEHGIRPSDETTLCVVVDETSRFYQQCDEPLNTRLLIETRDSAIRCGVPVQFCLFQDLLEERAVHASVYVFCNLFHLTAAERDRLHEILARKKATAVWLYAPGYIDEKADVENISATTKMEVRAFDKPAKSGSKYLLTGRWLDKDEEFGNPALWQPLFYIVDASTNVIAKYKDSGNASVAVRFLEEGWASIYVADPSPSAGLFREILLLLEQHVYFRRTSVKQMDAAYFGPNLIAIHAGETGERLVDLDSTYDVQDILSPDIGWAKKQVFNLMMEAGETRILRLTPATEGSVP